MSSFFIFWITLWAFQKQGVSSLDCELNCAVVWNGLVWDNFIEKINFSKIGLGQLYIKIKNYQKLETTLRKK